MPTNVINLPQEKILRKCKSCSYESNQFKLKILYYQAKGSKYVALVYHNCRLQFCHIINWFPTSLIIRISLLNNFQYKINDPNLSHVRFRCKLVINYVIDEY